MIFNQFFITLRRFYPSLCFYAMDKYSFVEKLGRGSHGTVYLLETNDSRRARVVCKSVVEKFVKHAQKEVSILKELNNKRIIKLIEYIQIKGSSFLILEYANHGTLDTVIKFFIQKNRKASQYLLWSVISQVSEALEYLHKRCIIHRDIKPSNILINQIPSKLEDILEFKLCDFSLAMELNQEDDYIESTLVGTPFYMSPEIIQKKKYNNTVDIWSLGVSMYELATLNRPFIGENRAELFNSILTNKINMNIIEDEYLRDLISMCLQKDDRPSSKWLSSQDKIRLHIANLEIKFKDSRIAYLENRLKILESHMKWSPSSPRHN